MKKPIQICGAFCVSTLTTFGSAEMEAGKGWLKFTGGEGAGKGKHIVLLAGDEEYRSEEAMPMLARILTERHGFNTTVLFSIDENGIVDPQASASLAGSEALGSADAIVMSLRFRSWGDVTMTNFMGAVERGVPMVALRTSTHIFKFPKKSKWAKWNFNDKTGGFGRVYLGETWVSHWGKHKSEATRGELEKGQEGNPLLNGVEDVFGDSDTYEAAPPEDATILLRGIVLKDMKKGSPPADHVKATAAGVKQGVNDPAMPIAWSREVSVGDHPANKVLTITMGAATDLASEGLRRLVVNGVYWGTGLEVPEKADISIVGTFTPTFYTSGKHHKGRQAADFVE